MQKRLSGRLDLDSAAVVGLHNAGVPSGDGVVLLEALLRVPGSGLANPRLEEGARRRQEQKTQKEIQFQANRQVIERYYGAAIISQLGNRPTKPQLTVHRILGRWRGRASWIAIYRG